MKYQVYQHWDDLQVCVVGRTYPPEFYHWITDSRTRSKFECMAQETEEDYQSLISLLINKFGVTILRPDLPEDFGQCYVKGKWVQPPTAPRDYFIMIGDEFWLPIVPNASHAWSVFYRQNKKSWWPDYVRPSDFFQNHPELAPDFAHRFDLFQIVDQHHLDAKLLFYSSIFDQIHKRGNNILQTELDFVNGCFVSRIGQDIYFATQTYYDDHKHILSLVNERFPATRNHIVDARGHGDAVYCAVTPGLIISLNDVPTYQETFPDWEVVYLPPSDYEHMREFKSSMKNNKGRWFIPGFEQDTNLQHMVDHYFDAWVGQVSETVFDVNILIVNQKNIIVSSYNEKVAKACMRYGVEMHVVPFRHRYFWDCGIHCITNDLDRLGTRQNFFPDRG